MSRKCTVIVQDITDDDIDRILNNQKNTASLNERRGSKSALSKALDGSKRYLKTQGFTEASEE